MYTPTFLGSAPLPRPAIKHHYQGEPFHGQRAFQCLLSPRARKISRVSPNPLPLQILIICFTFYRLQLPFPPNSPLTHFHSAGVTRGDLTCNRWHLISTVKILFSFLKFTIEYFAEITINDAEQCDLHVSQPAFE